MLINKLFAIASTGIIFLGYSTVVAAAPVWETIGRTNTGETLMLDINSPDTVGYGEAVNFTYKIIKGRTVRVHKAGSEDCFYNGQLSGDYREWYVKQTNGYPRNPRLLITAESNASRKMLERVCRLAARDKNPELGISRK